MTNTEENGTAARGRKRTLDGFIGFRASNRVRDRLQCVAEAKGVSASALAMWLVVGGLDRMQREMIG